MYQYLSTAILPDLIPQGSRILVAVSGGPDSVALAHVLKRYREEKGSQNLFLVFTHVNHLAREEARAEAELVERMAQEWGIPFILHEFNARENALKEGRGFQEASRDWRYARWREDMEDWDCNILATAHHLGDQAETVLYRLLRGSGTTGLSGIFPSKNGIIRPLLSIPKKEILAYCHREGLKYAVDQSNLETHYDRNRIRLELIPYLEKNYNEKIQESLGRTAEILRWDEEFFSSLISNLWSQLAEIRKQGGLILDLKAWDQPPAILSRLLRKAAAEVSGEERGLEHKYIKTLMKNGRKTGWSQDLPGFKVQAMKKGLLFLEAHSQPEWAVTDDLEIELSPQIWHAIPGTDLVVGIFDRLPEEREILFSTEFDKYQLADLGQPLVCRGRRPGDRMYFEKLGHKNIKKVFQERDISRFERQTLPLIAVQNKVIWIPGVIRSDSLLPRDEKASKLYCLLARKQKKS
ncbi:MAG: tRNA lysidine(34) synthetase TilS [Desulfitobacteriia bacterium]|jgi:tRNA(Ile)-lysidine synthase